MTAVYIESSALLRWVFDEEGASEVDRVLRGARVLLTSRLTQVEAQRALLRARISGRVEARVLDGVSQRLQILWPRVDWIEMTKSVCDEAGRVAPDDNLRTLDAIHLASFRRAREREPGLVLLSFDGRLLKAADARGLR